MPSYIRPRKYFSRQEILLALRDKGMRRVEVVKVLDAIFSKVLPASPRRTASDGYHKTTVSLKKPKDRKLTYYQLLYRLERDGFIKTNKGAKSLVYKITTTGLRWLKKFEREPHLTVPNYTIEPKQGDRVIIVSYDIPERLHMYRDWLRIVLASLELTKMHQSVWIGKIKLPTDFIADIARYKLEKYIEIFEITKTGTLRHRL